MGDVAEFVDSVKRGEVVRRGERGEEVSYLLRALQILFCDEVRR